MKKIIVLTIAFALCLSVLCGCIRQQPSQPPVPVIDETAGQVREAVSTVTVNGQGELVIEPDIASIHFGVNVRNKASAKEATEAVGVAMGSIAAALKAFQVAEADIQTAGFSLYEHYNYDKNGNPVGKPRYDASNTLYVTLYDINAIGGVIDAAVAAGANNTYGIQFSVKDRAGRETEVLAIAMENAKTRAASLAQASGKTLGEVLLVSDGTQMSEQVYYDEQVENRTAAEAAIAEAAPAAADSVYAGGASSSSTVMPGSIRLMVNVSVRFTMN